MTMKPENPNIFNEDEELISVLRLDCILLKGERIKFRIYGEDRFNNATVDEATLEMFYNWSKYAYENNVEMLEGGFISEIGVFEFIVKKI